MLVKFAKYCAIFFFELQEESFGVYITFRHEVLADG